MSSQAARRLDYLPFCNLLMDSPLRPGSRCAAVLLRWRAQQGARTSQPLYAFPAGRQGRAVARMAPSGLADAHAVVDERQAAPLRQRLLHCYGPPPECAPVTRLGIHRDGIDLN